MSCPIFLRTIIVFSGLEGLSFSCYRSSFLRPGTLEMNSFLASNENYCMCILCSLVPDCNPVDSSLPGSSVHGIFQARILVWVAISFSRRSSQPRDQTSVSCISCLAGRFSTTEPPEKPWRASGSHQLEIKTYSHITYKQKQKSRKLVVERYTKPALASQ